MHGFFFRWRDRILSVHGFMDVSLERRGHPNPKWIFCIVYIYIPGTQMTLVLIGKDQGSTNPGIYIYMAFDSLKFGTSFRVIWQKRIDLVLATYQPGKSDTMLMVILWKHNAAYKYSVYIYIYTHVCM